MDNYPYEYIKDAHRKSYNNLMQVKASSTCCCFACLEVFTLSDFPDGWLGEEDPEKEQTVQCPYCGMDSVLGDSSGFPVSDKGFVETMNEIYFGEPLSQFSQNPD
ncbi:hypothetical protein [Rufibacter roseus]|uniref:Cytoplasmic protein n=1 Tax=Rufibacter roseus TaxID=1567108 RepID=A0ABW2DJB0_9BACT|nr:hypothetical protein [Rufibacter roseus]